MAKSQAKHQITSGKLKGLESAVERRQTQTKARLFNAFNRLKTANATRKYDGLQPNVGRKLHKGGGLITYTLVAEEASADRDWHKNDYYSSLKQAIDDYQTERAETVAALEIEEGKKSSLVERNREYRTANKELSENNHKLVEQNLLLALAAEVMQDKMSELEKATANLRKQLAEKDGSHLQAVKRSRPS